MGEIASQIAARLLVRQVHGLGGKLTVTNGQPALRAERRLAAALLSELSKHREAIMAYLVSMKQGRCHVCKSDLVDEEDQERLAGVNFLCDRGPSRSARWANGSMVTRPYQGCPFRQVEPLGDAPVVAQSRRSRRSRAQRVDQPTFDDLEVSP